MPECPYCCEELNAPADVCLHCDAVLGQRNNKSLASNGNATVQKQVVLPTVLSSEIQDYSESTAEPSPSRQATHKHLGSKGLVPLLLILFTVWLAANNCGPSPSNLAEYKERIDEAYEDWCECNQELQTEVNNHRRLEKQTQCTNMIPGPYMQMKWSERANLTPKEEREASRYQSKVQDRVFKTCK